MGTRGPIPNRDADLSREYDINRRDSRVAATKGVAYELNTRKFRPDADWHPIARTMWDAAFSSGMFEFYQNTDLAILYSLCDDISHAKFTAMKTGKVNALLLSTLYSALGNLGFTEGDRRRMRVELEAPVEEDDVASSSIKNYKNGLGVVV